jgi:hypothetical protein
MAIGLGYPKTSFDAVRCEKRVPMEVGVRLSGHSAVPGTETTFTQNVSSRGARVLSSRRWKVNDRVTIATMTGAFKSVARVAYCTVTPESSFAVGLEFTESTGNWILGDLSVA